jgi:aspartyl/asparaginyl beta-hydroxylase (cupin superfamily)
MSANDPLESQLRSLVGAAEQAEMQGRRDEAERLLANARSLAPEHPAVLSAAGAYALRKGDAAQARQLFEQSIAADGSNPGTFVNLASSLRAFNDAAGELKALDGALTLQPHYFPALIQKASLLEKQGHAKRAAGFFQRALHALGPAGTSLPAAYRPLVEHAQRAVAQNLHDLEAWLQPRMQPVREQHSSARQDRVDDCLGAILGKNRIYVQQPTFSHFPRLPAIQFYEREDFPWLAALERATDDIRHELLGLLAEARDEFSPYLQHAASDPLNQWKELNQSKRWSALFLWKDGKRSDAIAARCPKTAAALEAAPVVKIPHRGPTSFFSLLEPHTRIPPHTGTTNTRLTVHIPLIVPPKCGFRVGTQTREWHPGTALIFDDTIEHEAWNDSDQERVILIFDIWNPLLTQAERDLMTAATAAIAEYYSD